MTNRQILLASRPTGYPVAENFQLQTVEVPPPAEGEVLVKTRFISLDPAMRGWMNEGKSYIRPVAIGEVFRAGTAGIVVESGHEHFRPGDAVTGNWGVQEYALCQARELRKVDTRQIPLEQYLAALGMPGMTAYFGLLDVGQLQNGEVVVVSGASGAVGSVVGQLAKAHQCRVVGIAGGPEKCRYCTEELGYDACIDYKSVPNLRQALKEACPEGIDVYFDNVGGDMLDTVLTLIRRKARIVICGAISQYNSTTGVRGPANYMSLLVNRARMEGMVVFDYAQRYPEAAKEMYAMILDGRLQSKIHIEKGIENFLPALLKLFSGENFGKLVLETGER